MCYQSDTTCSFALEGADIIATSNALLPEWRRKVGFCSTSELRRSLAEYTEVRMLEMCQMYSAFDESMP